MTAITHSHCRGRGRFIASANVGDQRTRGRDESTPTSARASKKRSMKFSVLFTLVLLLSACSFTAPFSPTTSQMKSATYYSPTSKIVVDVLKNFQQNGFDANPAINNGRGGLWINWLYGTQPLQANLTLSGVPSKMQPPQHDWNTDVRYLHNLWLFKAQHPNDTQFDDELSGYTTIVKYEFQPSHIRNDWRGWHYDEFMDLYRLSHDNDYRNIAYALATMFATLLYHPAIGMVYETTSSFPIVNESFPNGIYRVDDAVQIGCALIEAGTQFAMPQWTQDGKNILSFVYAHAYLRDYHTFLYQMSNVLLPDGTANPDETISRIGTSGIDVLRGRFTPYLIDGGVVAVGNDLAQSMLSLLHVYIVTHQEEFLEDVVDLLTPLSIEQNTLGLWDSQQLGYFVTTIFPGADIQHPGRPQLMKSVKEAGRQVQMLEVVHLLNTLTHNRYSSMQNTLYRVATQLAYERQGHGYVFEENANWTPMKLPNGHLGNWVTTEAMGIALEALQSLTASSA